MWTSAHQYQTHYPSNAEGSERVNGERIPSIIVPFIIIDALSGGITHGTGQSSAYRHRPKVKQAKESSFETQQALVFKREDLSDYNFLARNQLAGGVLKLRQARLQEIGCAQPISLCDQSPAAWVVQAHCPTRIRCLSRSNTGCSHCGRPTIRGCPCPVLHFGEYAAAIFRLLYELN